MRVTLTINNASDQQVGQVIGLIDPLTRHAPGLLDTSIGLTRPQGELEVAVTIDQDIF